MAGYVLKWRIWKLSNTSCPVLSSLRQMNSISDLYREHNRFITRLRNASTLDCFPALLCVFGSSFFLPLLYLLLLSYLSILNLPFASIYFFSLSLSPFWDKFILTRLDLRNCHNIYRFQAKDLRINKIPMKSFSKICHSESCRCYSSCHCFY